MRRHDHPVADDVGQRDLDQIAVDRPNTHPQRSAGVDACSLEHAAQQRSLERMRPPSYSRIGRMPTDGRCCSACASKLKADAKVTPCLLIS